MPFGLLEGIGLGSTIIGGIGSLFGSDGQDQLKKALAEAKRISQTGIDPQTMARLRASRQNLASNEISGQRASAASRLQRQGAPGPRYKNRYLVI